MRALCDRTPKEGATHLAGCTRASSEALKALEGFLGEIGAEGSSLTGKLFEHAFDPRRLRHGL